MADEEGNVIADVYFVCLKRRGKGLICQPKYIFQYALGKKLDI